MVRRSLAEKVETTGRTRHGNNVAEPMDAPDGGSVRGTTKTRGNSPVPTAYRGNWAQRVALLCQRARDPPTLRLWLGHAERPPRTLCLSAVQRTERRSLLPGRIPRPHGDPLHPTRRADSGTMVNTVRYPAAPTSSWTDPTGGY